MRVLFQDVRFAARTLAKSPAFTIVATITLALAIGANTAIFSLINTAIFGSLPYPDADRLVRVFRQSQDGTETRFFSYPDYLEYRDRSEVFEGLLACSFIPVSIGTGDANEMRFGQVVTGNYFTTLGTKAIHGRMLTVDDNQKPGGHPVVVIGHRYWQRAYGGRPDVVGDTITLSGHPFTIVGVAPPGFSGALPIPAPDLWVPLMMLPQIRPESRDQLTDRSGGFLWVMGKLRPALSQAQAQARLVVTAAQLKEVDPERYEDEYALLVPADGIIPMTPGMRRTALALSALVMSMVGLVLLVGCANVANLLLARSVARRREIGIRLAIGASRWRVVRQLLTESVLLALLGGTVGMLLAIWTVNLLANCLPHLPFDLTLDLDIALDQRVLAFTGLVSIVTGVLFGLIPALAVTRVDLAPSLKDNGRASTSGWGRLRMHNVLVVGQVAVSLVLLIGAGLFTRSLLQAHAIDPGFVHHDVLAVVVDLGAHDYDEESSRLFHEQLLQRVRTLSGVRSASIEDCPPLSMTLSDQGFWIEDRPFANPDDERITVAKSTISSGHFETLGIPLLRGRDFTEQDTTGAPGVAIVNQAFADRHWPDQNPLGKLISPTGAQGPYLEVIGVAATIKYRLIGEEPRPYIYLPLSQNADTFWVTLLVRTMGDPIAAVSPVREVIRSLDPNISPSDTRPFTEMISFILLPAKFAAGLFGLFGVLALMLASAGLYGVMSSVVGRRTHEIGVRVALGAQHRDVLCLVLKQGLKLTAIGLVCGLVVAGAGTRVFSSLLYEISTTDPLIFIAVSLLLAVVALLACYIPARRATKVDPMVTLKYE